jgi:hypothetical protein
MARDRLTPNAGRAKTGSTRASRPSRAATPGIIANSTVTLVAGPPVDQLDLKSRRGLHAVDWFQVPVVLPYGSVTRVHRVVVRDTFGIEVDVRPGREASRPGWAALQSTPVTDASWLADVFVLAPTVPGVLESEPLEEVELFRDEFANLAWAVERVVPARRPVNRWCARPRRRGCRPASRCRTTPATPTCSTG